MVMDASIRLLNVYADGVSIQCRHTHLAHIYIYVATTMLC